jgi:hypothetical protein
MAHTAAGGFAYPRKGYTALSRPTNQEIPLLDHPLELVNSTKTKLELFFGAITASVMKMARKPSTCNPAIKGY